MRYLAAITPFILALAIMQPVATQSFKPDNKAGYAAYLKEDYATALRHFKPLANQGHTGAQTSLGYMYRHGKGVPQDYAKAARWYRLAAKQGNARAQHNLGLMYAKGHGITQDYAEAFRLFSLSAKRGHAQAQTSLGWMYQNGWGVTRDYAEAVRWYRLAAKQGYAQVQTNLAKLENQLRAEDNWPPRSRQAKAKPAFTPDFQLGRDAYSRGDYATALMLWRPLAEQGNAGAQNRIGMMYSRGKGVTLDNKEAVRWYRKAADQGDTNAHYWLAKLENQLRAEDNWPPRSRQAKAKPAFTPDWRAGSAAYKQKDYATALKHIRPLAEQGHVLSQHDLGKMYDQGWGVTKDYKEAVKWYRKAVIKGDSYSMLSLASKYKFGLGVRQDLIMSYVWYNLAAAYERSGITTPGILKILAGYRDEALAKLNASERKLALKLSKRCFKNPEKCPEYSDD